MAFEVRSFDGSGNNLRNPGLNALAGTDFVRFTPVDNTPSDVNARVLSNTVVGENGVPDPHIEDPVGSGFMYAWGQFLDHDLSLQKTGTIRQDIPVPSGDPSLPSGSLIQFTKAAVNPATGAPINTIDGFVDASMVYGSSKATADALRLPDGHLRVTHQDGQDFLPIDNNSFHAGDVRVGENSALTSLQTLFLREHNHQVDVLKEVHPDWTGDQLYQGARAIVGAEVQHITYDEFLPQLLGRNALDKYHGYDPSVDPRVSAEFAGASFRLHSLVSDDITHTNEDGSTAQTHSLASDFGHTPQQFIDEGGPDGLLRNLASEHAQLMDNRIVEDLRSSLGDPVGGAQDLAAVNVERGRDFHLGSLNETREALGLKPYTSFSQITSNDVTAKLLADSYHNDINQVDLWLGGSSETHAKGAMVGPTFQALIAQQFENSRDGDRFWFESGTQFSKQDVNAIKHTSLGDIIDRNTDTKVIQDNVFKGVERDDLDHLKHKDLADGSKDFAFFKHNAPAVGDPAPKADVLAVASATHDQTPDLTQTDAAKMLKLVVDNAHQEAAQAQDHAQASAAPVAVPDKPMVTVDTATDTFHFNFDAAQGPQKAAPEPLQALLTPPGTGGATDHPDAHTASLEAHAGVPDLVPAPEHLNPSLMILDPLHHGMLA